MSEKNRKATENDIHGINAVIEANNKEPDAVYRYPYTFDEDEKLNRRDRLVFVTEVDSIIIAFLSLDILNKDCEAEFIIVVHPAHRDREKHYGEKLLKYVISYVRDKTPISCIYAGILKENEPSTNLCEKCGLLRIEGTDEKSKGIWFRLSINREHSRADRDDG